MGDTRLRSLERAAAAGDVEAQARQLAERVRAGTLTRERLELAAYCSAPSARLALDGLVPHHEGLAALQRCPHDPALARDSRAFPCARAQRDKSWGECLDVWVTGLGQWPLASLRGALAAAQAERAKRLAHAATGCMDCPACDLSNDCPHCGGTGAALGSNWENPCEPCEQTGNRSKQDEILEAIAAALPLGEADLISVGHRFGTQPVASNPAAYVLSMCKTLKRDGKHAHLWKGTRYVGRDARNAAGHAAAMHPGGEEVIRAAMQRALIAWALGPAPAPPAPHLDPDPELPPTPVSALDGGAP